MDVQRIRHELREGESKSLRQRRKIALLSAVGAIDFAVISLYQLGVIRHLPDPPGSIFDSDKVNASPKAYGLGVPDGTLGTGLYALTLVLAGAGGSRRSGRHPAFDVLLGAAVAVGVAGSAHYLYDMIRNQERACPYCLLGAATHFTMLPLALPGTITAVRRLGRSGLGSAKRRRTFRLRRPRSVSRAPGGAEQSFGGLP